MITIQRLLEGMKNPETGSSGRFLKKKREVRIFSLTYESELGIIKKLVAE